MYNIQIEGQQCHQKYHEQELCEQPDGFLISALDFGFFFIMVVVMVVIIIITITIAVAIADEAASSFAHTDGWYYIIHVLLCSVLVPLAFSFTVTVTSNTNANAALSID